MIFIYDIIGVIAVPVFQLVIKCDTASFNHSILPHYGQLNNIPKLVQNPDLPISMGVFLKPYYRYQLI